MENEFKLILQGKEVPEFIHLSDDGTHGGAIIMTGNYAATPMHFFYKALPDEVLILKKFSVQIQDTGNLDAGRYGNNVSLTNGIRMVIAQGNDLTNIVQDFTSGTPVKTNGEWGRFGTELEVSSFGTGDNYFSVNKVLSTPLAIDGTKDLVFGAILNDDFTQLQDHTIFIEGSIFKK